MSDISIALIIKKRVSSEVERLKRQLIAGTGVDDFAAYREKAGRIAAFQSVVELIEDAVKDKDLDIFTEIRSAD